MDVDPRSARIARNEGSFREINERLEQGMRKVQHAPELVHFVCECGNRDCDALIDLTLEEYEHLRADSRRFAILPGHALPDTERVLAANERYEVVQKIGGAVKLTDASDRRVPGPEGRRSDDPTP